MAYGALLHQHTILLKPIEIEKYPAVLTALRGL
jgi:hypothetical protein